MPMRDDFCAFILTHGRPDVPTVNTLERSGYTGKVYIVIDDEDKTADEYRKQYGDQVLTFCREDAFAITDDGDNFGKSRGVVYARNVCWDLARQVGVQYFIVLDDDYTNFEYAHRGAELRYSYTRVEKTLDEMLSALVEYFATIPAVTLAMSQGGDHIGGGGTEVSGKLIGGQHNPSLRRKAMNAFICSVDRPFTFTGHINEDVNAYVTEGRRGKLFFTVIQCKLVQSTTQTNPGGLTDFYLDAGTYVKSFYSVIYAPSCVQIGVMGDPRGGRVRIHHKINWHHTAPKILREEQKRILTNQKAELDGS